MQTRRHGDVCDQAKPERTQTQIQGQKQAQNWKANLPLLTKVLVALQKKIHWSINYYSKMIYSRFTTAIAVVAAATHTMAFTPSKSNGFQSSTTSRNMGPPTDPAAPEVETYGEGSRKYRRTVYTHNEWVKHRSSERFVNNLTTLVYSGIYKNIGKEVLATTSVAIFVWAWNLITNGYEDFSGVMHDPLIASRWATEIGLPLTIFTTLSPSLGLLLGE